MLESAMHMKLAAGKCNAYKNCCWKLKNAQKVAVGKLTVGKLAVGKLAVGQLHL